MKRLHNSNSKSSKKQCLDDDHNEEDRISQFPEHILHHILSFLPTKDATKTCVLSKTWNSARNSFPVLDFNQTYFQVSLKNRHRFITKKPNKFKKLVQDFCNYVDSSINRRQDISVQKFILVVFFKHTWLKGLWKDLDRWLNYALSNDVEHLVFHYYKISISEDTWPYLLPTSTLFRAKSSTLKELDLFGCKLVQSGDVHIGVSLKKLKLEYVYVDEQILQSLLSSSSSNLEELSIQYCDGFQSLNLSSTKLKSVDLHLPRDIGTTLSSIKLKSVDLHLPRDRVKKIAIEAPNLRFLSYSGDSANVLSSLEASNCHKNLKELVFHDFGVTDAICRVIREFRALEKLKFIRCNLQMESNWISDLATNVELPAHFEDCYTV